MYESTKGKNYLCGKEKWDMEFYLSNLKEDQIKHLLYFRTGNNKLPVETGRYNGTPYEDRKCPYCVHEVGDEFRYLLQCSYFSKNRKRYLDKYYYTRPNMLKFSQLMTCKKKTTLTKLAIFVKLIMKEFV